MRLRRCITGLLVWLPATQAQDAPAESKSVEGSAGDALRIELRAGESYFRESDRPVFVLGRNPAGRNPAEYAEHFRHAAAAGERFVRIHFTWMPEREKAGGIDPGMLRAWDAILDSAGAHGLAVLPVLGVWSDWNDGSNGENWHRWDRNPFNAARGGPARLPGELFQDTACRELWLNRLIGLVRRWSPQRAIIGWEIFSEVDLVTGANEEGAVEFAECAADAIRQADPRKRAVTASQAGVNAWPKLLRSSALDFIQIHPYADGRYRGRLDELILSTVRERLQTYGKPVMIGESGLDSGPPHGTLDAAPRAEVGIRHAIWAAIVSGAMNGRALWWQDGYDQFEQAALSRHYQDIAAPAAAFACDVNYSGFAPMPCVFSAGVKGAAIGNGTERLAWFRDARCEPPDWPDPPIAGQWATLAALGTWQVEFFDPATGTSTGRRAVAASGGNLRLLLPEFQQSIALRMRQIKP